MYVNALRSGGEGALLFRRWSGKSPLWLSSVVLEELYAGALPKDHPILDKLERDFDKAKRILVPALSDWIQTGKVLARMGRKYGYETVGRAPLTNDALLAMSAARPRNHGDHR
jgi:predicted nucleic acid-binding protein